MMIDGILALAIGTLKGVKGIDAIVLGGSRATGTATQASDIDLGIYYGPAFDLAQFRAAAAALDDQRRTDCVTALGEWGPWINGGGWLTVQGTAVDLLFRDTQKVSACVEDCIAGRITIDDQCGHPFGFINAIYMAEVYHCKVLYAASGKIEEIKDRLKNFPQGYKKAAVEKFLWECSFSLQCGEKAINKNDLLYAVGSLYRAANCLIQTLFAINERYCLNEKGSLDRLLKEGRIFLPQRLKERVERAFFLCHSDLAAAFAEMTALYREICDQAQS